MNEAAILSVQGLSVTFNDAVPAVNGVSFDLGAGESLGIVGESGSGKSVTVQALMGLITSPPGRITGGTARFRGRDLLQMQAHELRRVRGRDIAMVFQDPMSSLNPVLPIGLQMTEALVEHEQLGQQAANRRATEMLDLVGIANPAQRMRGYPHQMSGGQLQRVGIAMALVCKPAILIADEPTTALDVTVQAQIVELVARLQKQFGMAIIWISHDLGLVAGLVDRVAVMYGGTLVETMPVRQLFSSPVHPYTIGLLRSIPSIAAGRQRLVPIPGSPPNLRLASLSCPFTPRCAYAVERCAAERPPLEPVAPGHAAACWEWRRTTAPPHAARPHAAPPRAAPPHAAAPNFADVLVEVTDLRVHYPIRRGVLRRVTGAVRAVDGISFSIMRGETLALVGESGCGKSTTGRAILGLNAVSGGSIRVAGDDDAHLARDRLRARRRLMQMIFQNPYGALNPRMTVGRIIGEGLRAERIGTPATRERRVGDLLGLVGLGDAFRNRYPFELSGGQRQRVGIARALAAEPRFIIADEPISALDVSIQAQIVNLLDDLKRQLGLTYLFIGHDLSMVRYLSDRVAVMYLGQIVEIGATDDVFGQAAHPYTQALLSAIPDPAPVWTTPATGGRVVLSGGVPDPSNPPPGCRFHPRCGYATDLCRVVQPTLQQVASERTIAHSAACHHVDLVQAARRAA